MIGCTEKATDLLMLVGEGCLVNAMWFKAPGEIETPVIQEVLKDPSVAFNAITLVLVALSAVKLASPATADIEFPVNAEAIGVVHASEYPVKVIVLV